MAKLIHARYYTRTPVLDAHSAARYGQRAAGLAEEIRGTSVETLWQMVSLGMGYTVMPALAVAAGSPAAKALIGYRTFAAPEPARTIGLVWRWRSPSDPALRAIAEALRTQTAEEVRLVALAARAARRRPPAKKAVRRD